MVCTVYEIAHRKARVLQVYNEKIQQDRNSCQRHISRDGHNLNYEPYMTIYLAISLPKIPCIHCIYRVLANPTHFYLFYVVAFGSICSKDMNVAQKTTWKTCSFYAASMWWLSVPSVAKTWMVRQKTTWKTCSFYAASMWWLSVPSVAKTWMLHKKRHERHTASMQLLCGGFRFHL